MGDAYDFASRRMRINALRPAQQRRRAHAGRRPRLLSYGALVSISEKYADFYLFFRYFAGILHFIFLFIYAFILCFSIIIHIIVSCFI